MWFKMESKRGLKELEFKCFECAGGRFFKWFRFKDKRCAKNLEVDFDVFHILRQYILLHFFLNSHFLIKILTKDLCLLLL